MLRRNRPVDFGKKQTERLIEQARCQKRNHLHQYAEDNKNVILHNIQTKGSGNNYTFNDKQSVDAVITEIQNAKNTNELTTALQKINPQQSDININNNNAQNNNNEQLKNILAENAYFRLINTIQDKSFNSSFNTKEMKEKIEQRFKNCNLNENDQSFNKNKVLQKLQKKNQENQLIFLQVEKNFHAFKLYIYRCHTLLEHNNKTFNQIQKNLEDRKKLLQRYLAILKVQIPEPKDQIIKTEKLLVYIEKIKAPNANEDTLYFNQKRKIVANGQDEQTIKKNLFQSSNHNPSVGSLESQDSSVKKKKIEANDKTIVDYMENSTKDFKAITTLRLNQNKVERMEFDYAQLIIDDSQLKRFWVGFQTLPDERLLQWALTQVRNLIATHKGPLPPFTITGQFPSDDHVEALKLALHHYGVKYVDATGRPDVKPGKIDAFTKYIQKDKDKRMTFFGPTDKHLARGESLTKEQTKELKQKTKMPKVS